VQQSSARQVEIEIERSHHTSQKGVKRPFTNENILNFNSFATKRKVVTLLPKSIAQEEYIDLLEDQNKLIVFATGPAGTGKTMLAVLAAIKALKEGVTNKIIIARPAVAVENEQHGFLPGDLTAKMEPWVIPILDIMGEYYHPAEIKKMIENKELEFAPLAYLRGRTFNNAWVIFDEAQNSSINQMKMILTRLGNNSKMIITGDLNQLDRDFRDDNGLMDFIGRMNKYHGGAISVHTFSRKDVQRSAVVKEVLSLYNES